MAMVLFAYSVPDKATRAMTENWISVNRIRRLLEPLRHSPQKPISTLSNSPVDGDDGTAPPLAIALTFSALTFSAVRATCQLSLR